MGEWKRIFNRRMILLIVIAVLGNMCLYTYSQLMGRSLSEMRQNAQEYSSLVKRYQNMEFTEAKNHLENEYSAIRGDMKKQNDMDLQFKAVKNKLQYLSEYRENIDKVMQNAEKLKKFSIFSKPDSFSYNNILKTAKDFQRVSTVTLTLENDKGTEQFLQYYYLFYVAFALMLVIIYTLFEERENGMWSIVHSYAAGRLRLACKRLFLIAFSSLLITGLLYFTTLLVSLFLYGGWESLNSPIQSIQAYDKFTYPYSQLVYICLNFVLSWFALMTVSMVLWMLFVLFRSRNHALIFTCVFVGTEVLLYCKIETQSIYNGLHYINVVKIFQMNEILGRYTNWGFRTFIYSVLSVTCVVLTLLLLLAAVTALRKTTVMRPEARKSLFGRLFGWIHRQYQRGFSKLPITCKEIHKMIVTGKGIWVVIAVIVIAVYFAGSGRMTFTDWQKDYDEMYAQHGGKEYSYFIDFVEQKKAEYLSLQQEVEGVHEQYENGEVDLKTYSDALNNLNFTKARLKALEEYQNKIAYLDTIRADYGIDGYMMSDRGYEEIFGKYSSQRELILLLVLLSGIMIIISGCISMEYRTGMENIIRSCERGRGWILIRKMTACLIFTVILFGLVYGIDFYILNQFYGFPYLEAPLMSLTFMKGTVFRVSIAGYLCIWLLVRLCLCLLTMIIAVTVSKIIGRKGNNALMPLTLAGIIAIIIVLHGMGGII